MGIFWEVPGWRDEDFFPFLLLQKVLGNFNQTTYQETMHDVQIQNNTAFEFMRLIPDLVRYDGQFCPFSDVGIFGHFFQGDSRYA